VTETARLNDYTPDERIGVVARTEIQPGDHDWGQRSHKCQVHTHIPGKKKSSHSQVTYAVLWHPSPHTHIAPSLISALGTDR